MGMYDTIICRHPLPGDPPKFVLPRADHPDTADAADGYSGYYPFQSKDLDCALDTYIIDELGQLLLLPRHGADRGGSGRVSVPYTGTIDFYASNVYASCGRAIYTRDGSDAESVDYRAKFLDGKLIDIQQTERTIEPALKYVERREAPWTDVERAEYHAWLAENLIGRRLFLLWGGIEVEKGQWVEVVAETELEWCVRLPNGRLEVHDRHDRGRLLFDTEEEARKERKGREEPTEAASREWDEHARAWHARGEREAGNG